MDFKTSNIRMLIGPWCQQLFHLIRCDWPLCEGDWLLTDTQRLWTMGEHDYTLIRVDRYMDGQMYKRYQTYYLPATWSIKICTNNTVELSLTALNHTDFHLDEWQKTLICRRYDVIWESNHLLHKKWRSECNLEALSEDLVNEHTLTIQSRWGFIDDLPEKIKVKKKNKKRSSEFYESVYSL